ncbi:hypothetical protein [Brevundimonas sp.]|uniref:hypothetical protein n=1 Tax=Brevundimonas sp. TaxID=1871086 RepID=UPI003A9457AA
MIAIGIHIAAFAANFALMRWDENRLGMYRIMQGPADRLSNGLTLGLGVVYALALIALAVVALRDTRHPVRNHAGRAALVTATTLAQIALGFLITALGMIFAAGGIPQG